MRILLTGAKGQLAQDIWLQAERRGYQVKAFDHSQLDITNWRQVKGVVEAINPDVVINAAAYNAVDAAEDDWVNAFRVNGLAVRYLANICQRHDVILVHFSSDYVFDGSKERPYTIADCPCPLNKYGQSKLLGELEIRHCLKHYLIRTSWVFGLKGKSEVNFLKKLLSWAQRNDCLRIVTDQISSPSFTEDVAQAVLDLITTDCYGLYHVANGGYCSRYEWACFFLKDINFKGQILPATSNEFPTKAKRPQFSALDTFPLKELLGYNLPSWQEATERFLRAMGL